MFLEETYKGKTVLVTGHTGFKGSWLCLWLSSLGAKVVGLSDREYEAPSNYSVASVNSRLEEDIRCDVRDAATLRAHVERINPDYVFHLAAQPIVRESYADPLTTFTSNAIGSVNVLDAIKNLTSVTCVMITSDKVYENKEWIWGYRENDELGGKDPYSASKSMAEIGIRSYYTSFFSKREEVRVAVARAGNVIGGGDWAKDRIVPDTMRAWAENGPVVLRNPGATRPWQHVLEPLGGYLILAKYLHEGKTGSKLEAFNFGPSAEQNASVQELVSLMDRHWGAGIQIDEQEFSQKEAGLLRLNCDKAQTILGWKAVLSLESCAEMSVDWYRAYYEGDQCMEAFTLDQIYQYSDLLVAEIGADSE